MNTCKTKGIKGKPCDSMDHTIAFTTRFFFLFLFFFSGLVWFSFKFGFYFGGGDVARAEGKSEDMER